MAYVFRRPSRRFLQRRRRYPAIAPINVNVTLAGVAGVGVAGSITPSVGLVPTGVAGVGVAGSFAKEVDAGLIGVSGTGVAGSLSDAQSLAGVSGIGIAGSLTGDGSGNASGSLQGVVGVGLAGQISGAPSGQMVGVSGTGAAGIITVTTSGGGDIISGGGGIRRKNMGLEPVKKRRPPDAPPLAPLPIPQDSPPRPLPPQRAPIEIVDATLSPGSLAEIEQQALSALVDAQAFLRDLEAEEYDMQDVADVLAAID